jgi:hypothetical protein
MANPNKKKKLVLCPCGKADVELERDEDGDWNGFCGDCGRNLGRVHTKKEVAEDMAFTPEPEKRKKKGWLES